jgi:FkbM family methyltransferase
MNPARRLLWEYGALVRTLDLLDFALLLKETILNAQSILTSRKLTVLDAAMSRDMTVHFGNSRLTVPLRQIDQILAAYGDSPSFGTVREIYGRDCYLKHLRLKTPLRAVLDLGANRGMFSLLALVHLGAEIVVGVEPNPVYEPVLQLLIEANQCTVERRAPRYTKLISSPSTERANRDRFVSIPTILREQAIKRFSLVKIDIEGAELDLFSEPDWLSAVDDLTMELHPQCAPDMSLIPAALERYGFSYRLSDQEGKPADIKSANFLVASSSGLIVN